jgi:hypothetical protein
VTVGVLVAVGVGVTTGVRVTVGVPVNVNVAVGVIEGDTVGVKGSWVRDGEGVWVGAMTSVFVCLHPTSHSSPITIQKTFRNGLVVFISHPFIRSTSVVYPLTHPLTRLSVHVKSLLSLKRPVPFG